MEKVIRICKDSFSPLVPRPHSKKSPLLFKVLLNGEEARLPLETGNWKTNPYTKLTGQI